MGFDRFFADRPILVPAPNSGVTDDNAFSVPKLICEAMQLQGLGCRVEVLVKRDEAVQKSHRLRSDDRVTVDRHYETMSAEAHLFDTDHFVIVDDVITKGATLLAAASRLKERIPGARVHTFAIMRTIYKEEDFKGFLDPQANGLVRNGRYGAFRAQ